MQSLFRCEQCTAFAGAVVGRMHCNTDKLYKSEQVQTFSRTEDLNTRILRKYTPDLWIYKYSYNTDWTVGDGLGPAI